jgi:transcriptional regulator with XRE-family HTH domain
VLCGLSQTALADRLSLTFQQLQKYESGANRISASRLWQIAQVLDVPVSWFFMGIDDDTDRLEEFRTKRETLELVRNIAACPPEIQRRFRALLHSISEHTTEKS